jgi:NTE family protein
LVLVGGGARGAYQAGVLQGLAEILRERFGDRPPFDVVTGISAGAINAAYLASRADRMVEATRGLTALWSNLQIDRVMRTDAVSLFSIGSRWLRDLTLGAVLRPNTWSNHLLDATPLRELLTEHIEFDAIARHVASDILHGFAVSATSYATGSAVTFFDGHESVEPWTRSSRLGWRTRIRLDHILASASIPILFRPVFVEEAFYGDGGIRMTTPLSPAIHLGADRIVAISVRHPRSPESTMHVNRAEVDGDDISIADIAGVMLNAAFMDALDSDAERMTRINQTIALIEERRRAEHPHRLRSIPLLVIRPSVDLGALAGDQFTRLPATLRYLTRGLGASPERGADFLSYLAFDSSYARPLIEIGRRDALAQKDVIEAFFSLRDERLTAPGLDRPAVTMP